MHVCPEDLEGDKKIDFPILLVAISVENVKIEGKQQVACKLRAHDKPFIGRHGCQNEAKKRDYVPILLLSYLEQQEKHGNQDGYFEDNQSEDPGKAVEKIDNNLKKPVKIVRGMIRGNIGKGIGQGYLEIFKDQLAGL